MSVLDVSRFGKVAVLMGGISAEREISLVSGAAVLRALQTEGINAHGVDAKPENINQLRDQGFDRVFNILHGRWGEDGVVQGALQAINIPQTGSGVLGSALSMDKVRSKQVWQALGLPTASYKALRSEADLDGLIDQLGLPLFLKPALEGSSVGVAKVSNAEQLSDAYKSAAAIGDVVLAEQFLPGAELTVGILANQALPTVRLQSGNEFYDYDAKYTSHETQYFCPAGFDENWEQEIRQLAETAFLALGCEHWGRVDLMLDANDQPVLLEVNPIPGMTDHSLVPMAAAAAGISFEELVVTVLEATL